MVGDVDGTVAEGDWAADGKCQKCSGLHWQWMVSYSGREPAQRKCRVPMSESVLEDRNEITMERSELADTWPRE